MKLNTLSDEEYVRIVTKLIEENSDLSPMQQGSPTGEVDEMLGPRIAGRELAWAIRHAGGGEDVDRRDTSTAVQLKALEDEVIQLKDTVQQLQAAVQELQAAVLQQQQH